MERLIVIFVLFVAAGICEIGGGYLVWGWMQEGRPLVWAVVLTSYGVVATLQAILPLGLHNPHDKHLAT